MNNILFKISALSILISLAACGKSLTVGLGGGGQGGPSSPPVFLREPPKPGSCSGAAPAGSSIMGTWMQTQTLGNLTHVLGLYIEDNQTTFTVTCSTPNTQPLIASVKAPSSFDGSTLTHGSGTKTVGGRTGQCSSSLDGNPSTYSLIGSCLLININGGSHYFVRASREFLNF
jgi:hypothetical protein